ncbi:MAG: hypothetical protein WBL27_12920, partial [Salinimicrobium sp.]
MRNFTLGSKGMPFFLFALFLFSGTYLYGQNCPTITVDDDASTAGIQQTYCYLQTVADLQATANGDGIRWYRTASSTNPIPSNEILEDGNTYYAGNVSGTCTSREAVTVTVTNLGAPTPAFGSFFQPCEYGPGDSSSVQDLMNIVDADDPSYEIEVYTEEFSGNPLDPSVILVEGNSYFVGQTNPAGANCPSTRVAIQYLPVLSIAPTGDEEQQLCLGATVADLQAEATTSLSQGFRWYSTMTSNPALDPSTPLVDGETYYATQITNRTNSNQPPCESRARFAVTVDLFDADNVDPIEVQVCSADINDPTVDGFNDFLTSQALLYSLPTDGSFDPTPAELVDQFRTANGIGTFSTDYTVTTDCGVAVVAISIEVIESQTAEAGTIANRTKSETDPLVILDDTVLSADATTGGSFSAADGVLDSNGNFDPAIGPGVYPITYTVNESQPCVSGEDSVTFEITVTEETQEPNVVDVSVCSADINNATLAGFRDFYKNQVFLETDLPTGGTFDNFTIGELFNQYQTNPIGTFATTYTVGGESVVISVNVIQSQTAEAGTISHKTVNDTDAIIVLDDTILSSDATTGGNFTADPGVLNADGNFNPAIGPGVYPITYTVDNSQPCVSGQDSVTFNITVIEEAQEPNVVNVSVCSADINNATLTG